MQTSGAEPKVSVVTPFYNTSRYLAECIGSVLRQSYQNWEYILVDNCSTDGSATIANQFAESDPRIRVVTNTTFLTQIQNYNHALHQAPSDAAYIKVVEADNWLYPECLARMVALAEAHPRVGVVSSHNVTESRVRFWGLRTTEEVIDGRALARKQLRGQAYVFAAPTTVLLRGALVREAGPFYVEADRFAEDQSAIYRLLRKCDFGFVHQILSFIRTENEGSILSHVRDFDAQSLDLLLLMQRHGRDFFDGADFATELKRLERNHYAALANGLLARKGSKFWEFHGSGLSTIGRRVESGPLARAVAREILRRFSNPGESVRSLFHDD